jgi:hypothetical protein
MPLTGTGRYDEESGSYRVVARTYAGSSAGDHDPTRHDDKPGIMQWNYRGIDTWLRASFLSRLGSGMPVRAGPLGSAPSPPRV